MGFMDKLKNIFFEEEEEEEINETLPPKKEKEVIAKKVEVPKRRKEMTDFEIEPQEEMKKEVSYVEIKKEPKEIKKQPELIFDEDDFIMDTKPKRQEETFTNIKKVENNDVYKSREVNNFYKKEEPKEKKETPKYEYTSKVSETRESKTFTPSPIISPIYGILDKNYKKEEVKERKEIRISSRPVKMDLDSVRNKAFGDLEYDLFDNTETKEERDEKEQKKSAPKREIRKMYNTSKSDKPSIDKVTLGEADEYFNDLGLAYNTDYKDISKELNDGKIIENDNGDLLEDNLFDLIESMYNKED